MTNRSLTVETLRDGMKPEGVHGPLGSCHLSGCTAAGEEKREEIKKDWEKESAEGWPSSPMSEPPTAMNI